jgi:hypothetical protein
VRALGEVTGIGAAGEQVVDERGPLIVVVGELPAEVIAIAGDNGIERCRVGPRHALAGHAVQRPRPWCCCSRVDPGRARPMSFPRSGYHGRPAHNDSNSGMVAR